ncbi:MAG: hypothetical protein ACI94Y_000925 [Maribacter sp.]|jgi:hypothetical protein
MKNIQNKLVILLFIALTFPHFISSQDSSDFEMGYEVNRFYSSITVAEEKLEEVQTLADFNHLYRPSWVKKYTLVEVSVLHEGKLIKAESENDTLSQEQKKIIKIADAGTDVSVKVRYMPENTLSYNEIQNQDFSFKIAPANKAKYAGGQQQLEQYLKNAIDKFPNGTFKKNALSAVKFTINEEGQIIDALLLEPSKDEKVDKLLLETICNMPSWKPAEYSNGTVIKQESVLTVGDHRSCMVNIYIPFRISDDN